MSRDQSQGHLFRAADGAPWHFLDPADWERLGPAPLAWAADGTTVKSSGARKVCRKDGFFVKTEPAPGAGALGRLRRALSPRSRAEFRALLALRGAGIPTVEPVAWGGGGNDTLITREMPGAVTAHDFYHRAVGRDGRECPEFFRAWGAFVRGVIVSGFDHPDFHNGNILYAEAGNAFALVDVRNVRRRLFPRRRRMAMIVREFSEFLPRARLLSLLADCGIGDAATFYREMMRYAARFIASEWPRREQQFFADYPKFVAVDGGRRWALSGAREKIALTGAEKIELSPATAAAWRREDFRLSLLCLPRLRIAAFEAPGTLWREAAHGPATAEGAADLRERLELCGLNPTAYHFVADRFGRAALCPLMARA
ncbi:MAG: hypothetical protein J6333_10705 [Planctomycetes bacterium]|nr:hypothetical protein [Planctomycetota bacterium]